MKVTSNLSFLFCISSVVMPVIDARANVLGLKRSPAKKSFSKHLKALDAAVHQQRRTLPARANVLGRKRSPATKRNLKDFDAAVHHQGRSLQTDAVVCEALAEDMLAFPDSGCTCNQDGEPTDECSELLDYCTTCDTIAGERTCFSVDLEAQVATGDVDAFCGKYTSGAFDNKICFYDVDDSDLTCTATLDGTDCTSCALISCGNGDIDFDFDCSNVIAGETYNVCTDDIPETSPFLPLNSVNERFVEDFDCSTETPTRKEVCEAEYEIILGPNMCTCNEDGETSLECDELIDSCATCDTLQGERTCFIIVEDMDCATYTSGLFDNTICVEEDDSTCTLTVDGTECTSCAFISCSDEGDTYDLDCSNVIAGETWNLCTDDIPETSLFLPFGDNDRFNGDLECADDSSPTTAPTDSVGADDPTFAPTKAPTTSDGFALSFHALSVVGLIVVATFW
jgi:hypothetical protein